MTAASTTARSVLRIDGLVAGYGGGDVLRGVSLEVAQGGITCVVGTNVKRGERLIGDHVMRVDGDRLFQR